MKKVLCIDAKKNDEGKICQLVEGEIYTATGEGISSKSNVPVWYIQETDYISYAKTRFIPVSDIDETELLQQRQYETLTNETTI